MAERQTRIIDVDDVAWGDGSSKMTLPEGVRVKLFAEDEATGRTDMLINFPVGYVEPRHTHDSWHSCFLKEGHWLVEGERLGPGSYMHGPAGPGQAHGPFHSPEGTYVFVSVGGTGAQLHHEWDHGAELSTPAPAERARENKTRVIGGEALPWQNGSQLMTLPEGVRMKVFAEDLETGRTDALIEFPAGYVEPRHTHAASHSAFLLRGRWIVEGRELQPGSYFYGPAGEDQPHGPFESPEGTLIFICFRGGTGAAIEHHWEGES